MKIMNNYYKIDPPSFSIMKTASQSCHPFINKNYLEEICKLENGWYDVANSSGVFQFCVKNSEVIHSYIYSSCGSWLRSEFHKDGEIKDWKSIKDLHDEQT